MKSIAHLIRRIQHSLRRWGWKKVAFVAVAVLAVLFGLSMLFGSGPAADDAKTALRTVRVQSVAELSSDQPGLSVVGVVQSKSEATVRAEKSGQVVSLNRQLGDSVSAGAVVATIENDSERASVLSAQGAVDAAQASLAKVSGGSREEQQAILQASLETSRSGFESAQSSAVNTLLSAYATVDNAIRGTADPMFSNPDSANPQFNITSPDTQFKINVENGRVSLGPVLSRQSQMAKSVNVNTDLNAEIDKTEAEVRAARSQFDQIIRVLNNAIPTQGTTEAMIAGYQANAVAARASLNGTLSALSATKENLAAKRQGITIAEKNLQQGVTGGQPEDVAAAEAGLKQAQGALASARAQLEKSVIRAPISGTINSLSLKRGDYVQMATPVLTVANNGALEVVTYVTENDARDIARGSKVTIEDQATGVVTHIAPALDPVTKKIEVRVGVTGAAGDLINGQSVTVSIIRANAKISTTAKEITLPIAAIKIGSDKNLVFTVDENGKLVAHEVVLGALLGEKVVITSGITSDMQIVTDARGLRAGTSVEVQGAAEDSDIVTD